ncbi:hypothetical protein B9G98_00265 [Wickerhamiella sorbophila]|uniref:Uncharacterized protein n=1 Tax=Wickerhamiella sorbophila TaxID=45607 RepID=A0A2T0FCF3_9ASCO|nr:hypothetical protein B9G98_00265 [Wickerhamiella sorbophila]PRT52645.1 hypothetical protein B9G98_00265 [Wickerhamiella sorbophila]
MSSVNYSEQLRDFVCKQASEPLIEQIGKLLKEQRHAEAQWWQERKNLAAARVTDDKLAEFDAKVYEKLGHLAARHRRKLADMEITLVYPNVPMADQQKFLAFLSDLCK